MNQQQQTVQRPTNQAPMGQMKSGQPAVAKWLWITLIIVAVLGGFFLAWYLLLGPGKTTEVITPVTTPATTTKTTTTTTTPTTTGATTTTPTATTDLIYSNTKYGFTLTLPSTWKGYKMKEATLEGDGTATYYINVPTTDKSVVADKSVDAGYYSPFAISVYTLGQWTAIEGLDSTMDTLITKNDTYAFAWGQSNGNPPSDWNKTADIKTIIASFKLK